MPRLPGKTSTQKQIPIELAMIASFQMPWEDRVANKRCCIEGCGHKCSGNQGTFTEPDFCAKQNAATIYDERRMPGPVPDPFVGWACPCCVDKILDAEDDGT